MASGSGNFAVGIECELRWSIVAVAYDAGNLIVTDVHRFKHNPVPRILSSIQVIEDSNETLKVLHSYNCSKVSIVNLSLKDQVTGKR